MATIDLTTPKLVHKVARAGVNMPKDKIRRSVSGSSSGSVSIVTFESPSVCMLTIPSALRTTNPNPMTMTLLHLQV